MSDTNGELTLGEETEVADLDQENEIGDGEDEVGDDTAVDADDAVSIGVIKLSSWCAYWNMQFGWPELLVHVFVAAQKPASTSVLEINII